MIKINGDTKGVFIEGFITWVITFGASWVTTQTSITALETNQKALMMNRVELKSALNNLADKVNENAQHVAVSTTVLISLDNTMKKLGDSLDIIIKDTTTIAVKTQSNAVRISYLEK